MRLIAQPTVGELVRLDPLTVADAPEMAAIYADPRMFEFTGDPVPTPEAVAERYARLVAGHSPDGTEWWLNWAVRVHGSPAVIGVVQATVQADGGEAWLAWEIGVEWQGRGFGADAARAMRRWLTERGVTAFAASIHAAHAASQAIARGLGLAPTGDIHDGEQVWR